MKTFLTAPLLCLALTGFAVPLAAQDAPPAPSGAEFTVHISQVADQKAVFGLVQSRHITPARARIAGTVAELAITEGDSVKQGDVIAVVSDDKYALRIQSVNARIQALLSQKKNADTEFARAQDLYKRGIIPKARYDKAKTTASVLSGQLKSARADRNVLTQQVSEGKVLAPAGGRVLSVPITTGTVILPGEILAQIAEENFILRLALPERHARYMHKGDPVRIDASLVDGASGKSGTIVKVYPQISDGRVIADAQVAGLGDYFVGERVRVWVGTEPRPRIVVPAHFVSTRFGIDTVTVRHGGENRKIVVQRGMSVPLVVDGVTVDGLEILTGLHENDILVAS